MASKTWRRAAIAAAVIVVVGVAGGAWSRHERSKVEVQTGTVARRDLVSIVSASGEVKPTRFVEPDRISPAARIPGTVVSSGQGSRVVSGQRPDFNASTPVST